MGSHPLIRFYCPQYPIKSYRDIIDFKSVGIIYSSKSRKLPVFFLDLCFQTWRARFHKVLELLIGLLGMFPQILGQRSESLLNAVQTLRFNTN